METSICYILYISYVQRNGGTTIEIKLSINLIFNIYEINISVFSQAVYKFLH